MIQNPKSSSSSTNSKWEELLPALETIKSTSKIKKERLLNVVKIIKFLLSDEIENKNEQDNCETVKMLEEMKEEIKEDIKKPEEFQIPEMPDIDSIVEERLKAIKEVIDDRTYMLDEPEVKNKTVTVKNEPVPAKNKTADFSRILSKISKALAKLKDQNQSSETQTPTMMPIFRSQGCKNDFSPPLFDNLGQLGNTVSSQTGINPMSSPSMFKIPCQRASDILEETVNFPLPREAYCDNPTVNLNSLAKNAKLNLDNLPFSNIVPNSITCVDSDDTISILFKPKTISLMQVYGKLLKKITITVLVPYYVSKLAI